MDEGALSEIEKWGNESEGKKEMQQIVSFRKPSLQAQS